MSSSFGQLPAPLLKAASISFVAVASLAVVSPVVADERVSLTLAEAERLALENEPGRTELQARARAFADRSVAAEGLPDPTLRLGLANFPIERGGFSTEPMTQAQLGFRQAFPRKSVRQATAARFSALAAAESESSGARSRAVLQATRAAWLELHRWRRIRDVLEESRAVFADLVSVVESLYAVGRKSQHDVLSAELELSRLDDQLIEVDQAHRSAQAALSRWLGQDAYRPVAGKLPAWEPPPQLKLLRERLPDHPLLRAADAAIAAGNADVRSVEEGKRPGWALDVGYGYRRGRLPTGEPRSDFISVNVVVDLPFLRRGRRDNELSAALSERSAAVDGRRRVLMELDSELCGEYARWSDLTRRLALYEDRILDMSERQTEAALLAYQSDAGDFAEVIRSHVENLETQIEHIGIQTERQQAYAVLANLGGLSQ